MDEPGVGGIIKPPHSWEERQPAQNVNANQFGKLGAFPVDGAVYAQPLFVPALEILMAYSAETLEQKGVLNITPDGSEGGIWESDTGPAANRSGNIYVPTANGTFSAASAGRDYGNSVLKLELAGSTIEIRDYFTPYNQAQLSDADADLGSSGPLVLPRTSVSRSTLPNKTANAITPRRRHAS